MDHPEHSPASPERYAETLTKALRSSAVLLGLSPVILAGLFDVHALHILGSDEDRFRLDPARSDEWETAVLLIRFTHAALSIFGKNGVQTWLNGENLALSKKPIDLIKTPAGLAKVVQYLDAQLAH